MTITFFKYVLSLFIIFFVLINTVNFFKQEFFYNENIDIIKNKIILYLMTEKVFDKERDKFIITETKYEMKKSNFYVRQTNYVFENDSFVKEEDFFVFNSDLLFLKKSDDNCVLESSTKNEKNIENEKYFFVKCLLPLKNKNKIVYYTIVKKINIFDIAETYEKINRIHKEIVREILHFQF